MIEKYPLQTRGILLALFAMLTFSVNDGIFKGVLKVAALETVAFAGYAFSFLLLAAYGAWRKISFRPRHIRHVFGAGCLFLIEQIFFIYALQRLPLAELFVVVLATPVAVLGLSSMILKEHLRKQEMLAVILGFAGAVTVVAAPVFSETADISAALPFAWAAAVLNVVAGSGKIIYLRKYCQSENSFSISFVSIALVMIFYGLMLPSDPFAISASGLLLLAAGGGLGAVGCVAYIRAFQIAKAALASATQYSQIIWAVLMGVFIFGEDLTATAIAGSLLILTSGYLLYFKFRN